MALDINNIVQNVYREAPLRLTPAQLDELIIQEVGAAIDDGYIAPEIAAIRDVVALTIRKNAIER